MARITGELNFEFYVILISLNLKSHRRLAATILVAAYSFKSTTIETLYTFDLFQPSTLQCLWSIDLSTTLGALGTAPQTYQRTAQGICIS